MSKLNVSDLIKHKANRNILAMSVIYDYSIARAAQLANLDMILIGDSVGMVALGNKSTVSVELEEMVTFCKAVANGAPEIFLIGDMPFGSYEISPVVAVKSAISLIKSGGVNSVKLEGGVRVVESIRAIAAAGIPVMGHLGITPQSSSNLTGYKPYGKNKSEISQLHKDMTSLESAGVFSILLEGVASELTEIARTWVKVPVYGIGSGPHVDGQLILSYDILGLYPDFKPKFAKKYVSDALKDIGQENFLSSNLGFHEIAVRCFEIYMKEVKEIEFPSVDFQYSIGSEKFALLDYAKSL